MNPEISQEGVKLTCIHLNEEGHPMTTAESITRALTSAETFAITEIANAITKSVIFILPPLIIITIQDIKTRLSNCGIRRRVKGSINSLSRRNCAYCDAIILSNARGSIKIVYYDCVG